MRPTDAEQCGTPALGCAECARDLGATPLTGLAVNEATGGGRAPVQQFPSVTWIESTYQPTFAEEVLVAQTQRSWIFCPAMLAGSATVVVIKPPELPLQHARPPVSGLPRRVLTVEL